MKRIISVSRRTDIPAFYCDWFMGRLHDGKPVPKMIDFGIANATHQRLTKKTLFTRYVHTIGTPA